MNIQNKLNQLSSIKLVTLSSLFPIDDYYSFNDLFDDINYIVSCGLSLHNISFTDDLSVKVDFKCMDFIYKKILKNSPEFFEKYNFEEVK